MALHYVHVDVFSSHPYSGNSLAVFPDARGLDARQMLCITQELRHFETVFLEPTERANMVRARVFDLFEELPFAGHPLLGAAGALHHASGKPGPATWQVQLPSKMVSITTEPTSTGYFGWLDQGKPDFLGSVGYRDRVAEGFHLNSRDLHPELPIEVVSTGLRYLIVPVLPGVLERASIPSDITNFLKSLNAQFAVLLDDKMLEIRHWNNDGVIEDVATGSAAGTIGAYRLSHRLTSGGETFALTQGRFVGRAGTIHVKPMGTPERIDSVWVGGDVALVGRGVLEALPRVTV